MLRSPRWRLRLGVQTKLMLGLLLVLVPVLGLLLYDARAAYQRERDAVLQSLSQTAQAVAALADASIDEAITLGWAIAGDPTIRSFDPSLIRPYLRELAPLYPEYSSIVVLDRQGHLWGDSRERSPQGLSPIRVPIGPRLERVFGMGQPVVVGVVQSPLSGEATSGVLVPISQADGQVIGAVGISFVPEHLGRRLHGVGLRRGQVIGLTDPNGRLAFHTAKQDLAWEERDVSRIPVTQAALSQGMMAAERYESPITGDVRAVAFVRTPKHGWLVGVTWPVAEAFGPLEDALYRKLLGFGGIALLSALLAALLAHYLVVPVRRLALHARTLGEGHLGQRVQIQTGDELEELGQAFNHMAGALQSTLSEREAARARAERAAEHMTRLHALGAVLSEALMPKQVAEVVVHQGLDALGARAGSVVLLDHDGAYLEIVSAVGYPQPLLDAYRRFPLGAELPLAEAARSGEPIWLESEVARAERYPHLSQAHPSIDRAWAAIPLVIDRGRIGAIGLSFAEVRAFDEEDRAFMLALARECAQALERARLYEAERRARAEAEVRQQQLEAERGRIERVNRRLQALGVAALRVEESLVPEQVVAAIGDQLRAIELNWQIMLLTETGDRLVLEHTSLATDVAAAVERLMGIRVAGFTMEVDRVAAFRAAIHRHRAGYAAGETVLREVFPDAPAVLIEQLVRLVGAEGMIVAPLLARGRAIGTLTVWAKDLKADQLPAIVVFAQQVATAHENARLYREAQRAIRARDEFLSVAAHELRTPITSLRGFAQLLRRRLNRDGEVDPQHVGKALQQFDSQSEKLGRLVDHLLDVSRLEAGKFELERADTDLVELVESTVEATRGSAPHHTLVVRAPSRLMASVDPLRLEQALRNLLDNAIRFSPDSRNIEIEISQPTPETAVLTVRDHGVGIPPAHLPHVFDRFYQAHGDSHQSGLGLGLYISRQIVELHGGRIEAERPTDGGTRIVMTMPTAFEPAVSHRSAEARA